ncbi:putative glycerol-3-phosphate acyltransferase 3 [Platanthera guangdongensis]|uniref:Glycerol-3-phosphate acyltransferase 3 n=1 Tax=Platanthera guangdongensis TaxID=2320717 RepID=A0ABR2MN63_9ASPA
MFYATTVGGRKWMDPVFFMMNPSAWYEFEFLEKADTSSVRAGDCSRYDVANHVHGLIGKALGFQSTALTRKDKYTGSGGGAVQEMHCTVQCARSDGCECISARAEMCAHFDLLCTDLRYVR